MTYVVLFFMFLSAASFALSLYYYVSTARATSIDRFVYCKLAAAGHTGWGIIYMAVVAVILMVYAVVTL